MHQFERSLTFPKNHNCFKGHFSFKAIVPGAILLSYILQYLEEENHIIKKVKSSKFFNFLEPEQQVNIHFKIEANIANIIISRTDDVKIMKALIELE